MTLTVTGVLAADAHKCTRGRNAEAVVVFTVDADNYLPYEVAHVVGSTPEAHIKAERLAAGARRGSACSVVASKIAERRDHGAPCMVLREVRQLQVGGAPLL